jgi:hypothetical protein
MGSTLDFIVNKFNVDLNHKPPIEIFNCNRTIMAETFQELGFNLGVEVGVAQGFHSELFCKKNPNLHLFCVDAWEQYSGYRDYLRRRLDQFYEEAKERLSPYNCTIIRKFSMDAVKDFKNHSLDFVYIDGAHDFKNVADDICEWIKKVKSGGIIYGHDYKRSTTIKYQRHVVDVVCAYTYSHKISPWFILGETGRPDGKYREGIRQWMWVVE